MLINNRTGKSSWLKKVKKEWLKSKTLRKIRNEIEIITLLHSENKKGK